MFPAPCPLSPRHDPQTACRMQAGSFAPLTPLLVGICPDADNPQAFPLQIRSYPALSEIFLSQWAIKIITFNPILQLLHRTEGGLGGLGPDVSIFCCD